jgi:RND family efflux transporter MFP subunit
MKLTPFKLIAVLGVAGLVLGAAWFVVNQRRDGASPATHSEQLYTCGMHPQVIQNKPGNCPICGMKLTPIRKQTGVAGSATGTASAAAGGERKITHYKSTMLLGEISQTPRQDSMGMEMVPVYDDEAADSPTILIDPVTVQNMGIRTGVVTQGPLRRAIRTVGTVEFDETALAEVTTKFKGWIEKLYVDATGKQVHRGEPLFAIYSPDLFSAQTEYLLALNRVAGIAGSDSLQATALAKLKFFDISDDQITELEKTRQPKKALRINAPRDGIVVEKMAIEGQMVDAGMKLYRLADLSLVWVLSQIYEQDLPFLQLGQEAVVRLSYLPDREFRGRVTYIYPTLDEKTRTAKVRMEFHNPGFFLKPGMFATVELHAELEASTLLVPDSAVLRSGEKNTVFVALAGGKFDPRTITLGPRSEDNLYQVLSGLSAGERVVTSGQFMLDSESQLREAIQKMLKPVSAEPGAEHAGHVEHTNHAVASKPGEAKSTAYICPMPEHVSIKYERPGQCPICGMTLVPVSDAALAKLQPGGRVQHYTCPMPEHNDVKLDKAGKCPQCGMTLIPVMESPPLPTSAAGSPAAAPRLYTCPMAVHADVVSDKPGKCPKCEMDLVPTSTVKHGKTAEENWRKAPAAKMPAPAGAAAHQH